MMRFPAAVLCCVLWALSCYAQTTAVRPAQIQPAQGTADVTVAIDPTTGNFLGIGSTIAWRTDSTASPTITTADNTKVVELTFAGGISTTLPAATGGFGDGSGFEIQVAAGTLTLNATGASTINGKSSITVGPWQAAILSSRSGKWYAQLSVSTGGVGGPAIAHVQQASSTGTSTGSGASSTVTFPAFTAVGAGDAVVGSSVIHTATNTVTGITVGSTSATVVDFSNYGGGAYSVISFYAINVTGGPTTITINFSATPTGTDHYMMMDEYSNVAAFDANNRCTGASSATSNACTFSPSVATAMVWSGLVGDTVTANPSTFNARNANSTNHTYSADKLPGAAGSITVTWGLTGTAGGTSQELISLK